MQKKSQHVIVASNGAWGVRQTGATRSSKVFTTQSEAINYARKVAKNERGDLYVHRTDGTIQSVNSYSTTSRPKKS